LVERSRWSGTPTLIWITAPSAPQLLRARRAFVASAGPFGSRRTRALATFVDLGVRHVKNIQEPIRVYQVNAPGEAREAASARVAETERPPQLPDKPSIAVLPFQNMSEAGILRGRDD
jgi:adenylate cyclase